MTEPATTTKLTGVLKTCPIGPEFVYVTVFVLVSVFSGYAQEAGPAGTAGDLDVNCR